MGARQDFADALDELFDPHLIAARADVAEISQLPPNLIATIQVIRSGLEEATEAGAWWHDFTLWLLVSETDPHTVDDALDTAVEIVMPILRNLDALTNTKAERDTHPSGFHAYRITCRMRGTEI